MTLCIAWKYLNKIHFASDTRITFGRDRYTDIGIKIFSIPVKIFSETNKETGQSSLDYDHTIGMCIAGSLYNAYIVKESVYEVLQHLQYITHFTNISMDGISKVIFKFYEHISSKLILNVGRDAIAELFLGGYCSFENKIKIYKYAFNPADSIFSCEEILSNDGIELLGSGSVKANEILADNQNINRFKLLKEVINDTNVSSVGGNIQYGTFKKNDFLVKGVQDYELDSNGHVKIKMILRGTDLYEGEFTYENLGGYHISYPIILPFESDIMEAMRSRRARTE